MNRPLIITIGILIILSVIGLWAYLLIFGTPTETKGVFANFGITPTIEEAQVALPIPEGQEGTQLALTNEDLQQLTTRAVAGATFVTEGSKKGILYVESGTGHIYNIDLASKLEKQISVSTFAQTAKAIFSPEGNAVALIEFDNYTTKTSLGTINFIKNTLLTVPLLIDVENIAFKDEATVYFTRRGEGKTVGYAYDLRNLKETILFTIDLPEVHMLWGHDVDGFYAQTKPTKYLEGYIYKIVKGTLTPLPLQGFGLAAFAYKKQIVSATITDGLYTSTFLKNNIQKNQPLPMFGEKCVFSPIFDDVIWCAAPIEQIGEDYLENWYKGVETSEDYLWETNLTSESSRLVTDFMQTSGRIIDATNLDIDVGGEYLLFINKIDQTLWLQRIEKTTF